MEIADLGNLELAGTREFLLEVLNRDRHLAQGS